MLHVKIDLVPFGEEEGRKQISEIFIANVGALDLGVSQYNIWRKDPRFPANPKKPIATTIHIREDGCDVLAMRCLEAIVQNEEDQKSQTESAR